MTNEIDVTVGARHTHGYGVIVHAADLEGVSAGFV